MLSTTDVAPKTKVWPVLLGIAIVTIITAVIAATVIVRYGGSQVHTAKPLQPITQTVSGTVPPTHTTSAEPPPSLSHDFVAQALPMQLTVMQGDTVVMSTDSVKRAVRKYQTDGNFIIGIPPGDPVIAFDDPKVPWSGLPGSNAGQVILMGHANRDPPMVFNALSEIDPSVDKSNFKLVETLPGGVLTSDFVATHPIPKSDLFDWMKTAQFSSGTTLLVMCSLDMQTGQPLNTNDAVAWEFTLISSQAT